MNQQSKQASPIRLAKLFFLFGIVFYLIVCVTTAVFQRRLLFHPHVYTVAKVDQMARLANLERWTNSAGQFIGLKRASPDQPAKGSVLIAYGNGGSATGVVHYVNDMQNVAALDVFILEYPGYEDRPGSPTQNSLFDAASDALQMIPTNKPIYILGESLGSGVASYLAGTYPDKVAGILLLSPFDKLSEVAQFHYPFLPVRWLMLDRFPSEHYLQNYHGRVGVVVDGRDVVVPEKFGLELYHNYLGSKKLWNFPGGFHITIAEPPAKFWNEVMDFWQTNLSQHPDKSLEPATSANPQTAL